MHPAPVRRPRGFTLIELLTVIAIIGILAAIIIPVVGKVRQSARTVQCTSNLRQIGSAILLYAQDNNGLIPAALGSGGSAPTAAQNPSNSQWTVELNRYVERDTTDLNQISRFFACPQYQSDFPQGTTAWRQGYGYQVFFYRQAGLNTLTERARQTLTKIPEPSRTVVVADSSRETLRAANNGTFAVNTVSTTYGAYFEGAPERHGGSRANYLFLDGSVRGLSYPEAQETLRLRTN
jgi:general secretion pathway protein G